MNKKVISNFIIIILSLIFIINTTKVFNSYKKLINILNDRIILEEELFKLKDNKINNLQKDKDFLQKELNKKKVIKLDAYKLMQDKIDFAYELSGYSKDFILTLEAESQWFNTVSLPNRDGTRDYGYCQLNSKYHWSFINSEEFEDWRQQIKYCYSVWKDAIVKKKISTTFYGYNNRNLVKDRFYFKD